MRLTILGARRAGAWPAGMAVLLFLGALLWARGRDPLTRVWFTLKPEVHQRAIPNALSPNRRLRAASLQNLVVRGASGGVISDVACRGVAVLPKDAPRPLPVVIYWHGSGGNVLRDGNVLRQLTELGLAAVGMDYCQTNDTICEAQFAALLRHLQRQKWADTNAVAWAGFSLGAEKMTRFWVKHPESRPRLLVRLGGGGMGELENAEVGRLKAEGREDTGTPMEGGPAAQNSEHSTFNPQPSTVLLIHGDQDEVFPLAEAERVAAAFRTNGVPVELKVLAGQSHHLGANWALVFRAIGEYCLTRLRGVEALSRDRAISGWQGKAWPLWVFWLPALGWGGTWALWGRARRNRAGRLRAEKWVRWGAAILAPAAVALTVVHLGTPRLVVREGTLAVARWFLVQPQDREDFEYLTSLSCWHGQRLGTLLEHAHLARYNRSLVNWPLEDAVYREFVLPPVIGAAGGEDLRWRRMLWESLYPRVRTEQSLEAAAETVVRHLRERVTIAGGEDGPGDIPSVWRRQLTDEGGFQRLTVAGLRAVGIAARLDRNAQAVMFAGERWQPAPRPACADWSGDAE